MQLGYLLVLEKSCILVLSGYKRDPFVVGFKSFVFVCVFKLHKKEVYSFQFFIVVSKMSDTPSKSALKKLKKKEAAEKLEKENQEKERQEKERQEKEKKDKAARDQEKAKKEKKKDQSEEVDIIPCESEEEGEISAMNVILSKLKSMDEDRKKDSKVAGQLVEKLKLISGRLDKLEKTGSTSFYGDNGESSSDSESGDEVQEREGRSLGDVGSSLPEYKFEKSRNQHEYDFLRELSALLCHPDYPVMERLALVREAIETRGAVLITAQEDGWSVASELEFFETPTKSFMKKYQKEIDTARVRASTKASLTSKKSKHNKRSARKSTLQNDSADKVPVRSNAPSFRKGTFSSSASCFVCGDSEHLANKCPKRWKGNGGSSEKRGGNATSRGD